MKIAALMQLHNELENGHLIRCLENCKKWSSDIFIYDDCSTDGSKSVYEQYTEKGNIIYGETRDFENEIFHKQRLLSLVLSSSPDWIVWQDGDAILSRYLTERCDEVLSRVEDNGFDGAEAHYINLWRSESFYRLDLSFNDLWARAFWKNNGNLQYSPKRGLHLQQFPDGMKNICRLDSSCQFIHYGFSDRRGIVRKYLVYKSHGVPGVDRLIDEQTSYELEKVDKSLYPNDNIPKDYDISRKPVMLTYNEIRGFGSVQEFVDSGVKFNFSE